MKILIPHRIDKYLIRQSKGDKHGIAKVIQFLEHHLATATNPTSLPNCKKIQGSENNWRWRVGNYRIIAEIKQDELIIQIIDISTRENAYE